MSIRLDPRRLGTLKQLAAEADTRPGELVRIWVEERIDAERRGDTGQRGDDLRSLVSALTERVVALEAASGTRATAREESGAEGPAGAPSHAAGGSEAAVAMTAERPSADGHRPKRAGRKRVSAKPSGDRVALHDEIIAVLSERGPLSAAELAAAITDRGRYSPPRSGKPLDALTVNARVSNPTYRSRFTRSAGRIGLAEG